MCLSSVGDEVGAKAGVRYCGSGCYVQKFNGEELKDCAVE